MKRARSQTDPQTDPRGASKRKMRPPRRWKSDEELMKDMMEDLKEDSDTSKPFPLFTVALAGAKFKRSARVENTITQERIPRKKAVEAGRWRTPEGKWYPGQYYDPHALRHWYDLGHRTVPHTRKRFTDVELYDIGIVTPFMYALKAAKSTIGASGAKADPYKAVIEFVNKVRATVEAQGENALACVTVESACGPMIICAMSMLDEMFGDTSMGLAICKTPEESVISLRWEEGVRRVLTHRDKDACWSIVQAVERVFRVKLPDTII